MYKHAPFPPLSQLQLNLPPRIWEARDQPQPGSLPDDRRRDPGNEVGKNRENSASSSIYDHFCHVTSFSNLKRRPE